MPSWKKRKSGFGGRSTRNATTGDAEGEGGRNDKPKVAAFDRALGLLSRREHSARELSRKLVDRGHSKDEAATAVSTARERSYQSDARFAESVIRRRVAAGYGRRYIESELKSHGIEPLLHREAFDSFDWSAIALAVLDKRGQRGTDRHARNKAAQYLARRGFDPVAIKFATGASLAFDADE